MGENKEVAVAAEMQVDMKVARMVVVKKAVVPEEVVDTAVVDKKEEAMAEEKVVA